MWKSLFESAEGRDWPATSPEQGGEKMIRTTRVLLAALLAWVLFIITLIQFTPILLPFVLVTTF